MAEPDDNATAALAIMRRWNWNGGDPDGNTWVIWKELNDVENRLAMEGIERPQNVLIALLSKGELLAEGDYRWRKFQWGKHYRVEEINSRIKQKQWQDLANLIEWERTELTLPGGFLLDHVELTELGLESCYPYECEFANDRFSTSLCPPDTPLSDRKYFEESFAAWNIVVCPNWLNVDCEDFETEPAVHLVGKGGRPPANWWPDFAEEFAVYIHDKGIPDGQGHDGQSAIIDTIFARMVEQGKPEPGRGTVQPVVNAVLRRLRSAGN